MPQTIAVSAMSREAVLELNNAHAVELSWLAPLKLDALLAEACYARGFGDAEAFLLAFDQAARYDSRTSSGPANAAHVSSTSTGSWWHPQHEAAASRASSTSVDLFTRSAAAGHDLVVCEVNVGPPNAASDAFHATLGFAELGRGPIQGGKTVRYLARQLACAGTSAKL
jgi:predicted GNAT superfamily acetyltransferase